MTDHLTPEKRSWNMSRIRSRDTSPEKKVRSLIHRMGYRFRLHVKKLSGKPDIVLPKHKAVIFIQGCYWHHHENCRRSNWPKSNKDYWIPKIMRNIERDRTNLAKLSEAGWRVLTIWECETKDSCALSSIIKKFLDTKDQNSM